jgi:hypothetical protein
MVTSVTNMEMLSYKAKNHTGLQHMGYVNRKDRLGKLLDTTPDMEAGKGIIFSPA